MTIYQPYTYLIGWSKQEKYYYGVRYAEGCHPDELWVKYFTSSKYVDEFRRKYGEPDIIQIRKVFNTSHKAVEWESRVLSKINASLREDFINQQNGSGCKGVLNDSFMKKKKSLAMKKYWTKDKRKQKSNDMIEYNRRHGTERYREAINKRYANDEFKEQFTKTMSVVNRCPEKRKKAGQKIKEKWNNPEYLEKMKNRGGGRKKIEVEIDGVIYASISDAVNNTNLSYHQVRKMAGLVK